MDSEIRREIDAIAADTTSGATDLLARALEVLRRALRTSAAGNALDSSAIAEIAAALCRAQPAMAGIRTACAIVGDRQPGQAIGTGNRDSRDALVALDRLAAQIARAPTAIAANAARLLQLGHTDPSLRLVTCSRSRAVEATILLLAARTTVIVRCAEGRPALEGRGLAASLAQNQVGVELFSDAGISAAIEGAHAVLVGADAVGPRAFINKVGTAALCARAHLASVPAYVIAGREKIVPGRVFAELPLRSGTPEEIWDESPPGLIVQNPYFERVTLEWIAAVVTDASVLGPSDLDGEA